MDQKTFDELIQLGEISLLLTNGGIDLTEEQLRIVKSVAEQQYKEKLQQMAIELANSPGYNLFMKMPIVSSISKKSRSKKKKTSSLGKSGESPKKTPKVKSRKNKDPNKSTIPNGIARPLKFQDSEADVLAKVYNFIRLDYIRELKNKRAEKKFQRTQENLKDERNNELIFLFTGVKRRGKKKTTVLDKKEKKESKFGLKSKIGLGTAAILAGGLLFGKSAEASVNRTPDTGPLSGVTFKQLTKEQQNALLEAQSKNEGFNREGSLPNRMNNPGALMTRKGAKDVPEWSKKYGATLGDSNEEGTSLKFPTVESGREAQRELWEKQYGDKPISESLRSWAPSAPPSYAENIQKGIEKVAPLPQRMNLTKPVEGGKITSEVGHRRSPFTGRIQKHKGVDIAGLPEGSPVKAANSGTVRRGYESGGAGNYVAIKGKDGVETKYFHLKDIHVSDNMEVKAGDQIGTVGSTGASTSSHLHFEIWRNGVLDEHPELALRETRQIPNMAAVSSPISGSALVSLNNTTNVIHGSKLYEDASKENRSVFASQFFQ